MSILTFLPLRFKNCTENKLLPTCRTNGFPSPVRAGVHTPIRFLDSFLIIFVVSSNKVVFFLRI